MGEKISVPFVQFESKVPLIEFRMGNNKFLALIDTGSESTLFDKEVAVKSKLIPIDTGKEISFVGLKGEMEKTKVYALHEDFLIVDEKVNIFGIQSDLSSIKDHFKKIYGKNLSISAVLGSDFLSTYDAILDFEEHMMHLYM